jgi:16S rRNA (guanine966-N2)-methyltransferase
VTFVEQDRRAVMLIEANVTACGVEEGYTIACGDFAAVASRLGAGERFDLILLDPPYDVRDVRLVLEAAAGLLREGGMIILERATRQEPDVPPILARVRDVRSGDSTLTMFTHGDAPASAVERA